MWLRSHAAATVVVVVVAVALAWFSMSVRGATYLAMPILFVVVQLCSVIEMTQRTPSFRFASESRPL